MQGQCLDCGVFRSSLHKHHLIPQSIGGTDADGVVYICANCHEDRHGGTFGGHKQGLTNSPKAQAKRSQRMKELWSDPSYRERTLEARKSGKRRDIDAISEKVRSTWTPEKRAARSAAMKLIRAKKSWASREPKAMAV